MQERPAGLIERALIVHIDFEHQNIEQDDLAEFEELAVSAGAEIMAVITAKRKAPDAKYFIGSGKLEEIQQAVKDYKADVVLFNHALSPGQQRNIEQALETRVVDRIGLILDIFAQRARTAEGKLQVELAQLEHLATRLIRGWTHLERQKGGIGLRGPGETQLETDRRLLGDRIKLLKKRLAKVRSQRKQGRQARQRRPVPVVAIVGYTNAGKSTLFNVLTGAKVYAADQLFATLDPTSRQIHLPEIGEVVLVDTVGFIRHLPHALVDAFRATLEETQQADLLLHVVDVASEHREDNIEQVNKVLQEIDADKLPTIQIFNKIDLVADLAPRIDYNTEHQPTSVYLSAHTGAGMDLLQQALHQYLSSEFITEIVNLSPEQAKLRAALYALQAVLSEQIDAEGNCELEVRLSKAQYGKLFGATQSDHGGNQL